MNHELEIGIQLTVSGRILNRRRMGGVTFTDILSNGSRLQLFSNTELESYEEFIALPTGSFVEVSGETFLTRSGHHTLRVESYTVLLVPEMQLPIVRDDGEEVHNGIVNRETIRRRRYVQTILDPDERETFVTRSRIIQDVRNFFIGRDYLEVETPVLQPIYGGAEASPFVTRFNSLDQDMYLRIAPELYLRRMIIGGYERVFEIGRNFRNEGTSNRHNPEFTFMECYTSFEDYRYSMDLVEDLIISLGNSFGTEGSIEFGPNTIDMTSVARISYMDAVSEYADVEGMTDEEIGRIFETQVEPNLINPTMVYDYPASISPLAARSSEDDTIAERFEIFIAGMEIGNAYSELNDVATHIETMGRDDADFIEALRYGMPPTTGIGLGIDRLVMLFTNRSIRDVIYFPAMRTE